jgi:hypothetical protein
VARTQSFLQQGKADNDVLLYFPIYDKYSEPGRDLLLHFDGMKPGFNGTPFELAADTMQQKGYAFDYISDRQILNLTGSDKKIETGGASYQTIILPGCRFMKAETLQKLFQLADGGATILVYRSLPTEVPGYGKLKEHTAVFNSLIHRLNFAQTGFPGIKSAAVGRGRFLMAGDLQQLLRYASIRREDMTDKGLEFARRKNADGSEYYFIANRTGQKINEWITLQTKAGTVSLFNPMNGDSGLARFKKNDKGFTEVLLQLDPDESLIVQTAKNVVKANRYPYLKTGNASVDINGEWDVKFLHAAVSLPEPLKMHQLKPWTGWKDTAYQYFSGTASYTTYFKKPPGNASRYLLNLGKVDESAKVFINGKEIATLIGPVFSCRLNGDELKNENRLEIEVSNSMANRIIDLDRRHVFWKKFNNINFAARLPQNRDANGLFDASKWKPRVSGLEGPVTLTEIE